MCLLYHSDDERHRRMPLLGYFSDRYVLLKAAHTLANGMFQYIYLQLAHILTKGSKD